jgi:hypothetical protein
MRMRQVLLGGFVALGVLMMVATAAGAASVTFTPATIGYADKPVVKATGLTPNAMYTLTIYDRYGFPDFWYDFRAGADGSYSTSDLVPDQTDQPGVFTFEIASGGKSVAWTNGTLAGTNSWYVQHRLGS